MSKPNAADHSPESSEGMQARRRPTRLEVALAIALVALSILILLAVDVFPIITNDSLAYLRYSNALVPTGLVHIGYRQIGYPLFLGGVDAISSVVNLEPMVATALLQRIVYLAAVAFGVWLWRWRAIPLVTLAVIPSLVTYTNFVLTEGIAIGLVAWYAILVALAVKLSGEDGTRDPVLSRLSLSTLGILASLIYVALALIRFQYGLLLFGILAIWYLMFRAGGRIRVAAIATSLSVVLFLALFFGAVALENGRELGSLSPSARGERSRFWAAWQVTFKLDPTNQSIEALSDLYAEGSPYNLMGKIDRLPEYSDQQDTYAEALERLIDESGTTWTEQRLKSFLGVLRGGRFDDVKGIVWSASRSQFDTIEESMYRARKIREEGVGYFSREFNDGEMVQPVVISPLAPFRSLPYFVTVLRWALLAAGVTLIGGFFARRSRFLALVGLLTYLSTAVVFGYLLMDNVRFILTPLMFVVFSATGVGDILWRTSRNRSTVAIGNTAEGKPSES